MIYWYLPFFITFVVFCGFVTVAMQRRKVLPPFALLVFTLTIVLLFIRDHLSPTDAGNYHAMYASISTFNDVFSVYHGSYFFSFIQFVCRKLGMEYYQFSFFLSVLCLALSCFGILKIYEERKISILSICLFLLSSTFLLLYTNVIRQGLGLSLSLVAIAYLMRKRYFISSFLFVLGVFSHYSILVVFVLAFASVFFPFGDRLYFFLVLMSPNFYVLGKLTLGYFSNLGGLFLKIEKLAGHDYDSNLVYIKVVILYFFAVFIALFRFGMFSKKDGFVALKGSVTYADFKYVSNVYMTLLCLVFLTLPILILSSRYLYYTSAMMPIMLAFLVFKVNIISIGLRAGLLFFITIFYGFFVYFYKSTASQLGLYQ